MASPVLLLLPLCVGMARAHGGMTTPLPRNSFGQPAAANGTLNHFFSHYYDDGCLVGCDE